MKPETIHQISRRSFIRRCSATAAATGLPLWFIERELARAAEPAKSVTSPNSRPAIALIGCGGMGSVDAIDARRFGDIVAVCDVDSQRFRMACELVRNGRIGKLKEVTVWLPAGLRGGPFGSQPVPAELNWDFWQGQAKAYDYVPQRCHGIQMGWVVLV